MAKKARTTLFFKSGLKHTIYFDLLKEDVTESDLEQLSSLFRGHTDKLTLTNVNLIDDTNKRVFCWEPTALDMVCVELVE